MSANKPDPDPYLRDDLADRARKAGLNISSLTQEAIRASLAALDLTAWQKRVAELPPTNVDHRAVIEAVSSAKDDLESG